MTANALVSVIIPVHNRPVLLRDAVASVLAQTHRPIEIIIVDDGSTDDTLKVCHQLAAQSETQSSKGSIKITVIQQQNQGPGVARENGRQQATGEYIQYLDSDDLLLPSKLSLQIAAFDRKPEAQICYGKEARLPLSQDIGTIVWSKVKPIKATGEKFDSIFPKLLEKNTLWGTSVPLWRKSLTDKMGAWLPLSNQEDVEYDARAGAHNVSLEYVPEFLAIQRTHDDHLSSGGTTDPRKLRDILTAREHIFRHVQTASQVDAFNLEHYAKSVFLLARMFAAQGMKAETHEAIALSKKALGKTNIQLTFYLLVSRVLGVRVAQRLFSLLEKFR